MSSCRSLLSFGFVPISKETAYERLSVEVSIMRENAAINPLVPPRKKNVVGRPRLVTSLDDMMMDGSEGEDVEERPAVGEKRKKRPGNYKCWFNKRDMPKILEALKLTGFKVRETVEYLKKKYKSPGMKGQFHRLNESTVRFWLQSDGKTFKANAQRAITAVFEGPEEQVPNIMRLGRLRTWIGREELELEFHALLVSLRSADCGLNSLLIQFQMKAYIYVKCPEILVEGGGSFQVSRSYVRKWVVSNLGWSFRRHSSMSSSLPADWEKQGDDMADRVANLVFLYGIPQDLVVNADQTGFLLMPVGDEKTYSWKGSRKVAVKGRGDKRQVSLMLSITAVGSLMPLQVIFEGVKKSCILPRGQDALLLKAQGNHLTCTDNHWASQATMKDWIICIYLPWFRAVCREKHLDASTQKSILLLDCWTVHKSLEFRNYIRDSHPNICLLFVPAKCTSKLQPYDVVLNRPFKCAIQRAFQQYAVESIKRKLEMGISAENVKLNTSVGTLRNNLCSWLFRVINQMYLKREMLAAGWKKVGLHRSFEKTFQMQAMARNHASGGRLFNVENSQLADEPLVQSEDVWMGDKSVDGVFAACLGTDADLRDLQIEELVDCEPDHSDLPSVVTCGVVDISDWKDG